MCIINNTYGFVFVHIPKCGGTSLTFALSHLNYYRDLEIGSTTYGEELNKIFGKRYGIWKHSQAREIRNILGQVTWSKYYTFSIVRNPYARTMSTYAYLKHHDDAYTFMKKFASFSEFLRSDEWASSGPDRMFEPQVAWFVDAHKTNIVTDIFHLEDIQDNLQSIGERLGLAPHQVSKLEFPHRNKIRKAPHGHDGIRDEDLDLIYRRYKVDFDTFGYSSNVAVKTGEEA